MIFTEEGEAIIVTGDNSLRSVEALHENGSHWCSLPSLPEARDGHTLSGGEAFGGGASAATQRSCVAFRD